MPLRAEINGQDIFAYSFDDAGWQGLKGQPITMHCCGAKAIQKRSKLGTFFFAHSRRGECTSLPESPEHLFLKNLIATIALQNNWEVVTEQAGTTPDGEAWIADAFCTRGSAKLAFEVQWSAQTNEEFERRQRKYAASGVRAAWLYRVRSNKEYYFKDLPYGFEIPVFALKVDSEGNMHIPQFEVGVKDFVKGMLQNQLRWSPRPGKLVAKVIPHFENCWKCRRRTGMVMSIDVFDSAGIEVGCRSFRERGVPELLALHISNRELARKGIGAIKRRRSKTQKQTYLSNGCIHCDALQGNHFISSAWSNYAFEDPPAPVLEFEFTPDASTEDLEFSGDWYFRKMKSLAFF